MATKGFKMDSITDIFNTASMAEKTSWRVKYIDIDEIEPNEKNDYSIEDLEELRTSISFIGVRSNLEVMKTTTGKYKLLSGERRYTVVKMLVEEDGREDLRKVPCRVADPETEIEADIPAELKELWLLTATNIQRNKTDGDRMVDYRNHKKIYQALIDAGVKMNGRQKEQIAAAMKISPMQVQRFATIDKKLSPTLKAGFENNDIPLTVAYSAAVAGEETQKELEKQYTDNGTLTQADVEHAQTIQKKKEQRVREPDETVYTVSVSELDFLPVEMTESITGDIKVSGTDYDKIQKAKKQIEKQIKLIEKIIKAVQ